MALREKLPDPQVRRDFPDGYVESTDAEVLECVRITKGSATFLLQTGPACELLYKVNLYLLGEIWDTRRSLRRVSPGGPYHMRAVVKTARN